MWVYEGKVLEGVSGCMRGRCRREMCGCMRRRFRREMYGCMREMCGCRRGRCKRELCVGSAGWVGRNGVGGGVGGKGERFALIAMLC